MISNLPNLYHKKCLETPFKFNLMLIGSKGTGKTTFLNNFFNKKVLNDSHQMEIIRDLCQINSHRFCVNENDFITKMDVVEISGIGDSVNNQGCGEPAIRMLQTRHKKYANDCESKINRMVKDDRIHVCLYFIEAIDILKENDINLIKELSEFTNVIAVVGKADMLNEQESEMIRNEFALKCPEIDLYFISCERNCLLYREYDWGTINREDFDFYKLRELLLEKGTKELIEETEYLYNQYRVNMLAEELADGKDFLSEFNEQNQKLCEIQERIAGKRQRLNGN
ncbi:CDC3 [Ecytonucleospora hepatopenaei]|uniref:CDC3 n=1 Tax=Ecytonucleospora hepatopenaei TaxID=646526 RepID=A0A1W0E2F4_9MICR|nr:CDC3 [Ecytonucleospora hepatopenaei]